MSNVVALPSAQPVITPVGHVIRTGESCYRQIETLHAEGRLSATSVMVDASKVHRQKEFIQVLKSEGTEIILDTKCAELSSLNKFAGYAKEAPWALREENRPLAPTDFAPGANTDIYGQIARCAVKVGADAVLSTGHFLKDGANDLWLGSDVVGLDLLRQALDREGGSQIGIDLNLVLPHTALAREEDRRAIIRRMAGGPFDNVTLRLSGFGANAGPMTMKSTYRAIQELHALGKPILLDHVGGLVGLGAVALGHVSGLAHGVGEKEQFKAGDWHKPAKKRDPDKKGGRATYIPVPGFDKSFSKTDLEIIGSAKGGRRHVGCGDRNCCPHGLPSMLANPKSHMAYQRGKEVSDLAAVPDNRRAEHFLARNMVNAGRKARDMAQLKTGDESINKRLLAGRKRIDSLSRVVETLVAEADGTAPPPLKRRGGSGSGSSARMA